MSYEKQENIEAENSVSDCHISFHKPASGALKFVRHSHYTIYVHEQIITKLH
jgi:hypothetical protein